MIFTVNGHVTISCFTRVEANSPEEAQAIARQRQMCMVSDPARSGEDPNEVWFHNGELDGQPEVTGVEQSS